MTKREKSSRKRMEQRNRAGSSGQDPGYYADKRGVLHKNRALRKREFHNRTS